MFNPLSSSVNHDDMSLEGAVHTALLSTLNQGDMPSVSVPMDSIGIPSDVLVGNDITVHGVALGLFHCAKAINMLTRRMAKLTNEIRYAQAPNPRVDALERRVVELQALCAKHGIKEGAPVPRTRTKAT